MSTDVKDPKFATVPEVYVDFTVPKPTYDAFKAQADRANDTSVSTLIRQKLIQLGVVDSTKPIILNDTARQHLEKLYGKNFSTPDEIVATIQRALSMNINGVEISLTPYLLERLRSRAIGMDLDKFIAMTVKRLLEEFAGIR
jgi:hypothetical protein